MMETRVAARAASIMAAIALLAALPTGCGEGSGQGAERRGDREVRLYNWKDFTDKALLKDFEAETGITVYLNEFKTGEEMIASLQLHPRHPGPGRGGLRRP